MTPTARAGALFEKVYGYAPARVETAPGRVNIIGEHTDYNGGDVLPLALPQQTAVALYLHGSGHFRAVSEQVGAEKILSFRGPMAEQVSYVDYLRGVRQVLKAIGSPVAGMDLAIASDVPVGSGLSSSAALLVASLRAIRAALNLQISDFDLARLAHAAEHDYVGVPVGLMDPMASSLALPRSALWLNSRTLAYELIPFPDSLELAVIDSGQAHEHASGEYGQRRAECESAAATLGVAFLCDLKLDALGDGAQLSAKQHARTSHVLAEQQRVQLAVAALRSGDGPSLGKLLNESHASLRDLYEVSTPEIDSLVETAQSVDGCLGARITGGGFGGSIIILTRQGDARRVAATTLQRYLAGRPDSRARIIVPLSPELAV